MSPPVESIANELWMLLTARYGCEFVLHAELLAVGRHLALRRRSL
jgi:hypothetical protein